MFWTRMNAFEHRETFLPYSGSHNFEYIWNIITKEDLKTWKVSILAICFPNWISFKTETLEKIKTKGFFIIIILLNRK